MLFCREECGFQILIIEVDQTGKIVIGWTRTEAEASLLRIGNVLLVTLKIISAPQYVPAASILDAMVFPMN